MGLIAVENRVRLVSAGFTIEGHLILFHQGMPHRVFSSHEASVTNGSAEIMCLVSFRSCHGKRHGVGRIVSLLAENLSELTEQTSRWNAWQHWGPT